MKKILFSLLVPLFIFSCGSDSSNGSKSRFVSSSSYPSGSETQTVVVTEPAPQQTEDNRGGQNNEANNENSIDENQVESGGVTNDDEMNEENTENQQAKSENQQGSEINSSATQREVNPGANLTLRENVKFNPITKGAVIEKFPAEYTFVSQKNNTEGNETTQEQVYQPMNSYSPLEVARLTGAEKEGPGYVEGFDNIYIDYGKMNDLRFITGIKKDMKNCLGKCDSKWTMSKDNNWVLIYWGCPKNGIMVKNNYKSWNNADMEKLKNMTDLRSDTGSDKYPKIQLDLVQYIYFLYDPKKHYNMNKLERRISKDNAHILKSMCISRPTKNRFGQPIPGVHERIVKQYKFACVLKKGCGPCDKKNSSRDAFAFVSIENPCENQEMTFKDIKCTIDNKCGNNECGVKFIPMNIYSCGKKVKCDDNLAELELYWRITVQHKDKDGKIVTEVQEFEVN